MDRAYPADRDRANPGRRGLGLFRGFMRIRGSEKLAFLLAWILLGFSAAAIRSIAFKRLAPILGSPVGANPFVPVLDAGQTERARVVKRAMRRAALAAPFRSDCLPQALAGAVFCRMLGVPTTAHLGVRLGSEPGMLAHAWLCAGAVPVTGGPSFDDFTVVLGFHRPHRYGAGQASK